MSDGDGGPPSRDGPPRDSPPRDADEQQTSARSPATDPRAPTPGNPRRRLVVVGAVVLMLAASVGGVAWTFMQTSGSSPSVPTATFEHQYEGDGRTTLTHGGGDGIPAGDLVVEVEGDRASWADLRFGVGDDDTVAAGDTVVLLGVEPGDEVTLYYVGGDVEATVATVTVREPE
jgi:hypothetical protein